MSTAEKGLKRQKKSGRNRHGRPPSENALQLSDQLKRLSREKNLNEALKVYWGSNSMIRDGHHACIMVSQLIRCKRITILIESSLIHFSRTRTQIFSQGGPGGTLWKYFGKFRDVAPATPQDFSHFRFLRIPI